MKWLISVYIIIYLCVSVTQGKGQTYFNINKLVDVDSVNNQAWGYSIINLEKDTLKINGIGGSGILPFTKSYTYNLVNDTLFDLINRLDGTLKNTEYWPVRNSFVSINDTLFVLGCVYTHYNFIINSYDTVKSGLIYLNSQGDTIHSKWFGENVRFTLRSFDKIDNNLFLLGVTKTLGDGTKAHVVKTDLQGNLIWEKTLTAFTSFYCNAASIAKVGDGYFVDGIMNSHDIGPIHYSDVGLYRLDSNGNIVWYKKMFNNANGGCYNIREDGTGNYFLSANIDTMVNATDYTENGFILKMDSSTNIIWMHIFNEVPHILKNMWQYRTLPNGDLIFCGERLEAVGTNIHVGWMCRMDSSGNIKWEHYYKQNDSSDYNHLAEIKQMPDGGFIATGTCRDSITKKQSIWLIRTDSNGCLIPGCVAPNAIEVFPEDKMRFMLYPNPNNGSFIIESTLALATNAILKVVDITGRRVHTQQVPKGGFKTFVNINEASGLYLLQLVNAKGEIIYKSKIKID